MSGSRARSIRSGPSWSPRSAGSMSGSTIEANAGRNGRSSVGCIRIGTLTRRTRSDAMAGVGVHDQLKKVLQDVIAPDLHAIRADIRSLDQKIDGVDAKLTTKIDGLDVRLTTKIDALDQKIDGLDARLTTKIDALGDKVDDLDVRLTTKIDSLRTETVSLKGELLAEIRRVDVRIDGVDRELRTAIDIRERLAALEARRVS